MPLPVPVTQCTQCHFGSSAYKSECCEQQSLSLDSDSSQNQWIMCSHCHSITPGVTPLIAFMAVGSRSASRDSAKPRSTQSDATSRTSYLRSSREAALSSSPGKMKS
eukprot:331825-Amphidinium_carterae.1